MRERKKKGEEEISAILVLLARFVRIKWLIESEIS